LFQRQLKEKEPMTIVGDGLQRRDYTHVSDVVEANILASSTDNKEAIGEIFNIGSGTNNNIHDLVKMIIGNDLPVEGHDFVYIPERIGESRETLSDCTKAHNLLKWKPKIKLKEWITSCKQQLV